MPCFPAGVLGLIVVALAAGQTPIHETILPALSYGGGCTSSVELQNLGEAPITVDIEAHRESGGLVALADRGGMAVRLEAGERARYRLQIPEETANAWVRIREPAGFGEHGPVIAASGVTECLEGDRLISSLREAAYPLRNPWFAGDVSELKGGLVSLTNTSEQAATASVCYSAGGLFSVPDAAHPGGDLRPICSAAFDMQIPPFAARQFPVERGGNTQFSIRVRGSKVALRMLRPLETGVKVYTVDSTIRFGGEAPGPGPRE